jgi:hypothetical protein
MKLARLLAFLLALALPTAAWAAFPSVAATATSTEASSVTTHTASLPTGIVASNLLTVHVNLATTSAPTITAPTGWVKAIENNCGGAPTGCWTVNFLRFADGTEGSTMQFTTSAAMQSRHVSTRITDSAGIVLRAGSSSYSGAFNPDPPALTPTNEARDFLWLVAVYVSGALSHADGDQPSGYTFHATSGSAVTVMSRQRNIATEDPGTFNNDALSSTGRANIWGVIPQVDAAPYSLTLSRITQSNGNVTGLNAVLPTVAEGCVAGSLFVANVVNDGNATIGMAGWTQLKTLVDGANAVRATTFWLKSTGSEGSTAALTVSASEEVAVRIHCIAGMLDPDVSPPVVSTGATGSGTTPDPDSNTPSYGEGDYLILPVLGVDTGVTVSAHPAKHFLAQTHSNTSPGAGTVALFDSILSQEVGTSFDPASATISASEEWVTYTVAIPGALDAPAVARRRIITSKREPFSPLRWFLTREAHAAP